jgi:pimeloyl-ACP methyl ester carboxylesterase
MQYTTIGKGQPLVLIHGFGEDRHIWDSMVPELAGAARLILPELPGTGNSPLEDQVTMESMAGGIKAILDKEGIERAVLIGHSMGGYISLAFAALYPERLKALGLFHSTAFADPPAKKEARLKNIEFIARHGSASFLNASTPNLFAASDRTRLQSSIEALIQASAYIPEKALIAFTEAMRIRADRRDILKHLQVPVLFIVGKEDQAVPYADAMQQVHLPDLSYIHILKQSGHMGMLEENEKCTRAILQFLQSGG